MEVINAGWSGIILGCTALASSLLCSCSLMSGMVNTLKSPDQLAAEYGYVVVSRPVVFPLKEVETVLEGTVQTVDFKTALDEVSAFQSAGFRRFQVHQANALQASADLLAAQQLMAAVQAGQAPPQAQNAPALPTAAPPSLVETFREGALRQVDAPKTPYASRMQSAFHHVLLSRLSSAQLDLLKRGPGPVYVAFATLTIVPGEKTRFNASAEVRVKWLSEQGNIVDVVPIFPTYNSVAELDDAASLARVTQVLTALAQYGPAQAQGSSALAIEDVQRLVSASEHVTLVGAAMPTGVIGYRISGVRTARPFEELRPRGETKMEPLTLPMAVALRPPPVNATESQLDQDRVFNFSYSSRWRRDRPWWDKLPPGTLLPGFWYDRGTSFAAPPESVEGHVADQQLSNPSMVWWFAPWRWEHMGGGASYANAVPPAWSYLDVRAPTTNTTALAISTTSTAPLKLQHVYSQVIVVCGRGDPALHFFVDGAPIIARRVGDGAHRSARACPDDTYLLFLDEDLIRGLAKAHGVVPSDCREKKADESCKTARATTKARISAVNAAGPAGQELEIALELASFYPPPPPSERLQIIRATDGSVRAVERDAGTVWPIAPQQNPPK